MKKSVFFIAALLLGTVFNFTTVNAVTEENDDIETYALREHLNQNVTAYTGSISGHGATYGYYNLQYGTVAVKKWSNNDPYIPFGTNITLTNSIYLDGAGINKSQFMVTDTGSGPGQSPYWIDIYYGSSTPINNANALKFGNSKIVSYTATY